MVELDYDQVLEELTNLSKKPENDAVPVGYPEILDRYLDTVAKNGDIVFPWSKVKPFIRRKLELVMDNFYQKNPLTETQIRVPNCKPFDYGDLKGEIMKSFDWFYAAPFTIQRLCELLTDPGKHYKRTDKFMRGIEKNVLVVSTVQPRPNKYATPETMEKQANFKEMYPLFNSSPSHNNHSSSTSSASGSSSPSSGGVLNGSLESAGHGPNNSFEVPPQVNSYHPLANSFYDQAPPPPLNNHHPHLLDPMSDGPSGQHPLHPHPSHGHHVSPHGHASPHHSPHSSPLAPLQQLDSFTNVFATTSSTHHHLTHLTSTNYGPLDSTHLTNGSGGGAWSQDSPLKHHGSSPYDSLLNASGPHLHHANDHLNDDNENIIVDDDEEEEGVVKDKTGDSFFYTTDSSNSTNTSDSSSYNSDNSNGDKDEVVVVTTAVELGDAQLSQQQPQSQQVQPITETPEDASALERFTQEVTPKKRPSPTPPIESSPQCTEAVQDKGECGDVSKDEVEPPLTPKKLRVEQDEEEKQPAEKQHIPEQQQESAVELDTTSQVAEVEVAIEAKENEPVMTLASESSTSIVSITSSSNEEIVVTTEQVQLSATTVMATQQQPQTDDSTPMELNMTEDVTNGVVLEQQLSQPENGFSKSDDIAMQTGPNVDEEQSLPDDQVMAEPMDQE